MPKSSVIILDNIYDNPDEVRNIALNSDFNVSGNFPGTRSNVSFKPISLLKTIEKSIQSEITNWDEPGYNGSFQICTQDSIKTWIHSDYFNNWAGVLYLTPVPYIHSGTVFFRHKLSGADRETDMPSGFVWDGRVPEQWEITDRVANKYNRLVLYDASLFHASENYFGNDLYNGRLFQTFFFSSKDK